jgi:hypothetical protein
MSPKTWFFNF